MASTGQGNLVQFQAEKQEKFSIFSIEYYRIVPSDTFFDFMC